MDDNTPFQVTIAVWVNDSNKQSFIHTIRGIFTQELSFTKLCVIDSTTDSVENTFKYLVQTKKPESLHWYQYCRAGKIHKKKAMSMGFNFVKENGSPRTCLYMFLPAKYYLKPNFLKIVKEAFTFHKYTVGYIPWLKPKNGPRKYFRHFIVTSQFFDTYKTINKKLLDSLEDIPKPWDRCLIISGCYAEEL